MVGLSQSAEWTVKQPWRGLVSLAVSLTIALGITVAFKMDTFQGILPAWAMCLVPIVVVIGLVWGNKYPAEKFDNPWRGLALLLFAFIIASIVCMWLLRVGGGGVTSPILIVFIIQSVLTAFFVIIAFGCFPFHRLALPAKGMLSLLLSYLVALGIFRLFNFDKLALGFPEGLPRLGVPPLPGPIPFAAPGGPLEALSGVNPSGLFAWEGALAFYFWMFLFLFVFVHLGFWPFSKVKVLMTQPLMGISVVISCFVLALLSYAVGVWVMGLERIFFLVAGVSCVFGMLMIIFPFQMWPGRLLKQPVGGFVNIMLAVVVGFIAFYAYEAFATMNFGAVNMVYPENYFTLANMMLALTFPTWAIYCGFFDSWPLPPTPAPGEGG